MLRMSLSGGNAFSDFPTPSFEHKILNFIANVQYIFMENSTSLDKQSNFSLYLFH